MVVIEEGGVMGKDGILTSELTSSLTTDFLAGAVVPLFLHLGTSCCTTWGEH